VIRKRDLNVLLLTLMVMLVLLLKKNILWYDTVCCVTTLVVKTVVKYPLDVLSLATCYNNRGCLNTRMDDNNKLYLQEGLWLQGYPIDFNATIFDSCCAISACTYTPIDYDDSVSKLLRYKSRLYT